MVEKHTGRLGTTFTRFLISKSLSSISFNLFQIYFLWKIVSIYHSVFLAGIIPTIAFAVQLLSSIPIGHGIDRINSTILSFISTAIMILGFLTLLLSTTLFAIYLTTLIMSIGYTLKGDSFSAILKKHLNDEHIARGTSMNQLSIGLSGVLGIAAGGFSLLFLEGFTPLILLTISVAALLLSIPASEAVNRRDNGTVRSEYGHVISFYRKIVGFIVVATILNGLFVGLTVYSSGLFKLYLHSTPEFYTMFEVAFPAGMIFGSYASSRILVFIDRPHIPALLVLLYGPLIFLLGASRSASADILIFLAVGFINPLINVPLNARLTRATPKEIFGRVFAFLRIFIGGSTPVMAVVFTVLSVYAPVPVILMAIGASEVFVAMIGFSTIPRLYRMTETLELITS